MGRVLVWYKIRSHYWFSSYGPIGRFSLRRFFIAQSSWLSVSWCVSACLRPVMPSLSYGTADPHLDAAVIILTGCIAHMRLIIDVMTAVARNIQPMLRSFIQSVS